MNFARVLEFFSNFSTSLNWQKKTPIWSPSTLLYFIGKREIIKKDVGNNNTLPNFRCKENKEHKNEKGNGKWKASTVLGLF